MAKKAEIHAKIAAAENAIHSTSENEPLTDFKKSQFEAEINGLRVSEALFDRHISRAFYDLRTRDNKHNRFLMLSQPVNLTPETWESLLKEQNLHQLRPKAKLTDDKQ